MPFHHFNEDTYSITSRISEGVNTAPIAGIIDTGGVREATSDFRIIVGAPSRSTRS